MKKLTAESARQELIKLKVWENDGVLTLKEERYLQALEIALPILEQQERDDDEWIEWGGGQCPVADDQRVHVQFRDGEVINTASGNCIRWSHKGTSRDIIAYRIIPEQPTNQNGEQ